MDCKTRPLLPTTVVVIVTVVVKRLSNINSIATASLISLVVVRCSTVRYVGCKFGYEWAWQRGLHPIVGISHHLFTMIAWVENIRIMRRMMPTSDILTSWSDTMWKIFTLLIDLSNIFSLHICRIPKEKNLSTATARTNLEATATFIHALILIVDELNQWSNITFDTRHLCDQLDYWFIRPNWI